MKWSINRDSAEDKLRDFLEWMYAVKTDTLHHVSLHFLSPSPSLSHLLTHPVPFHRTGSIVTGQPKSSSHTRKHIPEPWPRPLLSATHFFALSNCPSSLSPSSLFFNPFQSLPVLSAAVPDNLAQPVCAHHLLCPREPQGGLVRPSHAVYCSDQQWHVLSMCTDQ